ncbi:hypothetical protein AB0I81_39950 [Nonomuraea sp. NPDC050404]|uniref:hypothetical protein n=1 Tax=Nonomuraea sp. NPDC050404 TaxID=3155783 RepID=UPI0033E617CE
MRLTLVPQRHPRGVLPYGSRRRMEALAALGWPISEQECRLGHPDLFGRLTRQKYVRPATARAIERLYSELWAQTPPDTLGSRRVKARAERAGWPRPAEWDDDLIDLPPSALAAAIEREVSSLEPAELHRCARDREAGGRGLLTLAAAREFERRKSAKRRERRGAVRAA